MLILLNTLNISGNTITLNDSLLSFYIQDFNKTIINTYVIINGIFTINVL